MSAAENHRVLPWRPAASADTTCCATCETGFGAGGWRSRRKSAWPRLNRDIDFITRVILYFRMIRRVAGKTPRLFPYCEGRGAEVLSTRRAGQRRSVVV